MKTLIFVLIIVSFIQTTIVPLDLVLLILICRSYVRPDKSILILAFSFGLLNAHLTSITLGLTSIIYLVLVALTESLSKTRLAGNSFLIIPLSLVMLTLNQILQAIFIHVSPQIFPSVFWGGLLSLPIFYLVEGWEERFIVRRAIKLKL